MISHVPPSGDLHHSLQSNDATTVRNELVRWLEAERGQLQQQVANHEDFNTILRVQGAIQVLDRVLAPLVERPTQARPPHYTQQ